MLTEFISSCRIHALQSESDVDNLIVSTTILVSSSDNSVVNGEDTELFILLLHHIAKSVYDFFFISEKSSQEKIWCMRLVQKRPSILGYTYFLV